MTPRLQRRVPATATRRWCRLRRSAGCLFIASVLVSSCNTRDSVLDVPVNAVGPSPAPPLTAPAPSLLSLSMSPSAVNGGAPATGTATFNAPAPADGIVVSLSSDDAAVIVPRAVTLPVGADRVQFPVSTQSVPADRTGTVTASAGARSTAASVGVWGPLAPTFARWSSEAGDYVGGGRPGSFPPSTYAFSAACSDNAIFISVDGPATWLLQFGAPQNTPLRVGTYEGATRASPALPTIDIGGNGRGCSQTTGRFVVHEADFSAQGEVRRFRATFEQRCTTSTGTLRGEVALTNVALRSLYNAPACRLN